MGSNYTSKPLIEIKTKICLTLILTFLLNFQSLFAQVDLDPSPLAISQADFENLTRYMIYGEQYIKLGDQNEVLEEVGFIGTQGNFNIGNANGRNIFNSEIRIGGNFIFSGDAGTFNNYVRVAGAISGIGANTGSNKFNDTLHVNGTVTSANYTYGAQYINGANPAVIHPVPTESVPALDAAQCAGIPGCLSAVDMTVGMGATRLVDASLLADTVVDLYYNNVSVPANNANLLFRANPWQLVRVFIKNNLTMGNDASIGVSNPAGTALQNSADYTGNLLLFVEGDASFSVRNRITGTLMANDSLVVGNDTRITGQVIAKGFESTVRLEAANFRYVPFNPPVIDIQPTAQAGGAFNETDVNTEHFLTLRLSKTTQSGVKFRYRFINIPGVGNATAADFNPGLNPVWSVGQFLPGSDSLLLTTGFSIAGDLIEEDDEFFYIVIDSLEGAVFANNPASIIDTFQLVILDNDANGPPVVTSTTVNLPENSPLGTAMHTVAASGATGTTLTYSIVSGNSNNVFAIDPATGAITVAQPSFLNYEVGPNIYNLSIEVEDNLAQSTQGTITIQITNVDEHPVLTASNVSVAENQSSALTATATNPDAGTLVWTLSGPDAALFSVNNGVVTFVNTPDYEAPQDANTDNVYQITVNVKDDQATIVSQSLTVTVTNVDEVPVLTATSVAVVENQTTVLTASATNPDAGVLVWSLSGVDANFFTINNGVISLVNAPDYENPQDANTDNVYQITVNVKDDQSLVISQNITVTILNLNEPATLNVPALTVDENSLSGVVVGVISATDPENNSLTFSISTSDEFVINPTTGSISVKPGAVLNYEAQASFNLEVFVTDGTNMTSELITIHLNDVNEAPLLTPETFPIPEDATVGTLLGIIQSTDEDGDILQLQIINNPAFNINSDGLISLVDPSYLDYEAQTQFSFKVVGIDPEGLADTIDVVVNVLNVLEFPNVEIILVADEDSSWTRPDTIWTNASIVDVDWTIDGVLQQDIENLEEGINYLIRTFSDPTMDGPGIDTVVVMVNTKTPEIELDLPIVLPQPHSDMIAETPEVTAPGEIPLYYVNDPDLIIGGIVEFVNRSLNEDNVLISWQPELVEGLNEVTYSYTDIFGNTGSKTIQIILDTQAPVVEILDPTNNSDVYKTVIDVVWTVDGVPMDVLLEQVVSNGKNQIIRSYRDKAGNVGSDTVYVYYKASKKDVIIKLEESLVTFDADRVKEFLAINPPEPNEVFALSAYNYREREEQELQWGRGSTTHPSDGRPPYPGLNGGHLGPTLQIDIRVPHIGGHFLSKDQKSRGGTLGELLAAQSPAEREKTLESCIERIDLLPISEINSQQLWVLNLVIDISIYDNIGQYVDRMRVVQNINSPDYINDDGFVTLFLEIKPDAESGMLKNQSGRHLATGAYIIRGFAKSEAILKCDIPDLQAGHTDQSVESILKIFGYARPFN
jgi:hypothetical protein